MDPLTMIDPDLIPSSGSFPSPGFRLDTLAQVRAGMLAKAIVARPADNPAVTAEEVHVPGKNEMPPVRVLTYRPTQVQGPLPVLLHLHGGWLRRGLV